MSNLYLNTKTVKQYFSFFCLIVTLQQQQIYIKNILIYTYIIRTYLYTYTVSIYLSIYLSIYTYIYCIIYEMLCIDMHICMKYL